MYVYTDTHDYILYHFFNLFLFIIIKMYPVTTTH